MKSMRERLSLQVVQLTEQLATANAAREQADKDARHYAERAEAWELGCNEAKTYWQQAERERDTALARVAELEALQGNPVVGLLRGAVMDRCRSAETALDSARKLLESITACMPQSAAAGIDAWLASHTAPVAAPCAGCAAVRAIVEPVSIEHGHRTEDTSLVLSELADQVLEALE